MEGAMTEISPERSEKLRRMDYILFGATILGLLPPYVYLGVILNPPATMPNGAVIELEKVLIDVTGILLGFSGVMFAQLLAGFQSKKEESTIIWRGILRVFIFLTFSIALSIFYLSSALSDPTARSQTGQAVLLPLIPMVLGILLIPAYMISTVRK